VPVLPARLTTSGARRPVLRTGAPGAGVPHGYVTMMLEAVRAAFQAVSSWVVVP